jgi:hypothetical protein
MHATIRRWNGASALINAMESRLPEVETLISSSPGFVSYHAVRSGDSLVTITVCQDKAGTDESTRMAAQWVRENLPADALVGLTPEISDGEAFANFGAP